MKRHDFKPRSISPLTCETCKEPKGAAAHAAPVKLVSVSFRIPKQIFDDLESHSRMTHDKSPSALAKKVVVKYLGYEYVPPKPKQIIPAQPGGWRKRGVQ